MTVVLRARNGAVTALPVVEWCGPATSTEVAVLSRLDGPVLDLGCGPGRLVHALVSAGVAALGVDASEHAVARAESKDVPVLRRSLFERLPAEGRWRSVLLFDGNIGIGGDPVALLRRVAGLLHPDGRALVEVDGPGRPTRLAPARLERGGTTTPWFPWAWVGVDALPWFAAGAGLSVTDSVLAGGRCFATLGRAR